jgi:hypothetical protein
MKNSAAAAVRQREWTRIDQLAMTIDRQRIGEGTRAWVAHVLGVHTDGRNYWVQVAPADEPTRSVVLRMSPWASAQHAIAALSAMTSPTESFPQIIDVMQPAS